MDKVLIGSRKVTWTFKKVIGGVKHVYIGIKDVDNINEGKYSLGHAIKVVIAAVENLPNIDDIQITY
jgi:rRNA processing protein Gar1